MADDDTAALQAQLRALQVAYYSGATEVSYESKTIKYRSGSEMLAAINSLQRLLGAGAPSNVVVRPRRWV